MMAHAHIKAAFVLHALPPLILLSPARLMTNGGENGKKEILVELCSIFNMQ